MRTRRQAAPLQDELDLDAVTRSREAMQSAKRTGLGFAEKAVLVLASVSALADGPQAIETSQALIEASAEVVETSLATVEETIEGIRRWSDDEAKASGGRPGYDLSTRRVKSARGVLRACRDGLRGV